MPSNTAVEIPYFEVSWAALSALGIHNVLVGLIIAGIIKGFPSVLLVPTVVSAACALANGLCYYAYYTNYPVVNKQIACAFADLFWLIQEAGLPFYGYAILTHTLLGSERRIFLTLFWALMFVTVAVRVAIMVFDVGFFSSPSQYLTVVNHLHIGYFLPIAMAECLSAVFLLRKFRVRLKSSVSNLRRGGKLYHYLMRSTEIRLVMLALIGISRTVTYSFHEIGGYEGVVGQLDLFVYMLGSFFPIIMFVDILASRLAFVNECSTRGNYQNSAAAMEKAALNVSDSSTGIVSFTSGSGSCKD